jgi:hypothetical protein
MPTSATPSAPNPAGDTRNVQPADATLAQSAFEERLRLFWQRNSTAVTVLLVAVLLGIAAKGGWEYVQEQHLQSVGREYAAATTPAELKAFVAAHPRETLAGAAQLRIADQAYSDEKYSEAIAGYEQALALLKDDPLACRARLGAAMARIQGGQQAEGLAALKALAADTKQPKAFRTEAAYHLAGYASGHGNAEDLKTYSLLISQIDPTSPWVQRAAALRALSPATGSAASTVTIPATPAK